MRVILCLLSTLATSSYGLQKFSTVPTYKEVNPGGSVSLACVVSSMKGECRWEKDGVPVGLYPGKYEMAGQEEGDCSLRILAASMEYDNGVWQCQVTASDFTQKDTLISDGAQLVVRGNNIKSCFTILVSYLQLSSFMKQKHFYCKIKIFIFLSCKTVGAKQWPFPCQSIKQLSVFY